MIRSTTRLRSINPLQFGIVLGIIYALLGFLGALFFLALSSTAPMMWAYGFIGQFHIFALIVFPLFYFCAGFLGGIITGAIYNLVAVWTGGVELTLEQPG